jgi:pimeloyl-ACP methyl ester carboxylesterase
MISVLRACALACAIYAPVEPVFSEVFTIDGIVVGYRLIDGCTTLTFRGSATGEDWLRDFHFVPVDAGPLGTVHSGFYAGMDKVFARLQPLLVGEIAIQGHSLGCAHAAMLAALCAVNGIKVDQLCLFAPPRAGYQRLRELVQGSVKAIHAYRNGVDPVPDFPLALPNEPWVQIADLIALDEKPGGLDDVNVFAYHGAELYLQGIRKLFDLIEND